MLQGATSNEVDIGSTLLAAATADFQVKSILRRAISQLREKYPATTALVRPVREKLRLPDRREPPFPRPMRKVQCERESASEIHGKLPLYELQEGLFEGVRACIHLPARTVLLQGLLPCTIHENLLVTRNAYGEAFWQRAHRAAPRGR